MLSFFEWQQVFVAEKLNRKRAMFHEVVNSHLDMLRYQLFKNSKLQSNLFEHHVPNFLTEELVKEDFATCRSIINEVIDRQKARTLEMFSEEAVAPLSIDSLGKALTDKVGQIMGQLEKELAAAMVSYTAPEDDEEGIEPSAGGSSAAATTATGSPTAPKPAGGPSGGLKPSGGPSGAPSGGPSGGTSSAAAGPAPSGKPDSWAYRGEPSFWKRLIRHPLSTVGNIGKNFARGARRWAYDDPSLEHIQNTLVERTASYGDLVKTAAKNLIAYINTDFIPKLKTVTVAPATAATAAAATATTGPEVGPTGAVDPAVAATASPVSGRPEDAAADAPDWNPVVTDYKWPRGRINLALKEFGQKIGDPRFEQGLDGFGSSKLAVRKAIIEAVAKRENIKPKDVLGFLKVNFDGLKPKDQRGRILRLVSALAGKYGLKFANRNRIDKGEMATTNVEAPPVAPTEALPKTPSPSIAGEPKAPPETNATTIEPEAPKGPPTMGDKQPAAPTPEEKGTTIEKLPPRGIIVANTLASKLKNMTNGHVLPPRIKAMLLSLVAEAGKEIDNNQIRDIFTKVKDALVTGFPDLLKKEEDPAPPTEAAPIPLPAGKLRQHQAEPTAAEPAPEKEAEIPVDQSVKQHVLKQIRGAKAANVIDDDQEAMLNDRLDDIVNDITEDNPDGFASEDELKKAVNAALAAWAKEYLKVGQTEESFANKVGRLRKLIAS